jgi:hypothetical protein
MMTPFADPRRARGELLCQAFEVYQQLMPNPGLRAVATWCGAQSGRSGRGDVVAVCCRKRSVLLLAGSVP